MVMLVLPCRMRMRIRTSLMVLSVASAAPLLAVAVFVVGYAYSRENAAFVETALTRNRATLQAVDAELRGSADTLRALSSAESITRKDYAAFHHEAALVLETQPDWQNILLLTADGRQVVNARLPWGAHLSAQPVEPDSFRAAVSEGRASVGNLMLAPSSNNELGIAVRVPVKRAGETVHVITAVLRPSMFQKILQHQRLPAHWVSGLVDGDGRLIARVPAVPTGTLAGADFRRAVARAPEGWYRGATIEGADTYTAFSRSTMTGWTIGYAIPSQAIMGGPYRAAALMAGGIALSVLSALAIGLWLSRRIGDPIAQLASSAAHMGSGSSLDSFASGIEEVMSLGLALRSADGALRDRDDELAKRRQELQRQADELRQVDASKMRFLSLVSHELRNPLAPLRNGLLLLEQLRDDSKKAEVRAMMDRQLALLERLVGDVVDLGRISRRDFELRRDNVQLSEIVRAGADGVQPAVERKRQSLVLRRADLQLAILGDIERLQQVVSNLLTNASKYTPEGGRIEVAVTQEGDDAVIAVSDNGVGFDPDDASRVFDLFVRLAIPGQGEPGSLGIGLAVARTIVQMHGGWIEAQSDGPGRGATFKVHLPLASRDHERPDAELASREG
jgi:signal transduction histidine kinase